MIFETRFRSISAVVTEIQKVELLPFFICISATTTDRGFIRKPFKAKFIELSGKKNRGKARGPSGGVGGSRGRPDLRNAVLPIVASL